jgi:hypothetical protein
MAFDGTMSLLNAKCIMFIALIGVSELEEDEFVEILR